MTAALPLIPVVDARLGGPLATARAAAVEMSDLLATARLIYSPPLLEAMDRVSYVGVITAIGRRDGLRPRSISRRCSHTARSCRSIGVEGRQGSGAGSSIRSTALTISCGAFRCGASRSHTRSQGSGCGGFDRTPKPGSPTAEPIVRRLTAGGSGIRTAGPPVKRDGVFRDHPDRRPPLRLPENQARGTEGSNPACSSGESVSRGISPSHVERPIRVLVVRWFESGSLQRHSRCSALHRIEARVLP